jgi:hypothetical protein
MNKLIQLFGIIFLIAFSAGCSKDDPSPSDPGYITDIMTAGTWRVSYFKDSDEDKTSHFTGYNFSFTDTGVLVANNGTNNYPGIWSVIKDDGDLKLIISFSSPADFTELNDDWTVLEATELKVTLTDVSGSGSTPDYLTLERN